MRLKKPDDDEGDAEVEVLEAVVVDGGLDGPWELLFPVVDAAVVVAVVVVVGDIGVDDEACGGVGWGAKGLE